VELPDTPDLAPVHETGDRSLLAAVAELSVERRVVVVLRYGVGMTPKQIAEALDLPVGTVNSRLARALEQLREVVEVEHVE
jgi:RNA polymerase sigma-70 factor (ECF subfamily)